MLSNKATSYVAHLIACKKKLCAFCVVRGKKSLRSARLYSQTVRIDLSTQIDRQIEQHEAAVFDVYL